MKTITAEEFDKKFDDGEDISDYVDWSQARRLGDVHERIDLDLPISAVLTLDTEVKRLGTTRQALIQRWIEERLEGLSEPR
ncbi:CopG family transcriptional regulator [Rhizobium sp. S152]|uniref:type II toxin-antitoxin system BrnA family antitoxin n=1 Tax=Rhizobium sp. S152 TaxID=3055038 RepID=UPI0025A9E590|nr:CopG family transcriptional regulator [Rhizobium sp. S152]MDM9628864.1 CopG family transcriptional regulator [Rhizobium sp. S152]